MKERVEKMAVLETDGLGSVPNLCKCAFCGQTNSATHPIYHSVFRSKEVGRWGCELHQTVHDVDEYGFAIYTCDRCISRHKRRLVLFWLMGWGWIAVCLILGCLCIVRFALDSPWMYAICLAATLGSGLIGVTFGRSLFDWYLRPWRALAVRHPQVALWLNAGFKFEGKDWPRFVRAGRDTESRGGPLKRREHGMYVSYEIYVWAGGLQNFSNKGPIEDNVHEAKQIFKSHEKRKEQYLRRYAKRSTPLKLTGKGAIVVFALIGAGFVIQQAMGLEFMGYVAGFVLLLIAGLKINENRGRYE